MPDRVPLPEQRRLAAAAIDRHRRSFAQEIGISRLDGPSGLFQLLVISLLMSARIRATVAVRAAQSLFKERWNTPQRMSEAKWADRVKVLNDAGYARYDERTATMLGEMAERVLSSFHGDLRRLRVDAMRDPSMERKLLMEFNGIGEVGADIFCRDVQEEWRELYPFADERALAAAESLGLPGDPKELADLAPGGRFVPLLNALVRMDLEDTVDEVRQAASRARAS